MNEYLSSVFGLKRDQAANEVISERIENGATVTGQNLYILILAILIASIGLNMNSTAVVIGAMLISPLMGVILAIAYAVSTKDAPSMRHNARRFLFQVGVSILTSTLYFLLSPVDTFSGELAARTQPTIYDVLIAIAGGLSAILANTRESTVSNVIPGAAIATALMPPLCTVGYCIATGNYTFAVGAGYLFLINAIFICLSAVLGLHVMGISDAKYLVGTMKSRLTLAAFLLITIVPSAYLAYTSIQNAGIDANYQKFLAQEIQQPTTQVVKSSISKEKKSLRVTLVGTPLSAEKIEKAKEKLAAYGLEEYALNITQTVRQGISQEEMESILKEHDNALKKEPDENTPKTLLALYQNQKAVESSSLQDLLSLSPAILSAGFSDVESSNGSTRRILLLLTKNEPDAAELERVRAWTAKKFGDITVLWQIEPAFIETLPTEKRAE